MGKWQRKPYQNQSHRDSALYKINNGRERQGPRALIDAYGTDDRTTTSSDRALRIERLDTNGLDHRSSTMLWQNSDEEEFNWEAMSPTLTEHSRRDNFLPSSIRNYKSRPDLGPSRSMAVESDIRNRWSSQGQLPAADESPPEDAISSLSVRSFVSHLLDCLMYAVLGICFPPLIRLIKKVFFFFLALQFGRGGPAGNVSQFHGDNVLPVVQRYTQESWNTHHHHTQPPTHLNPRGSVTDNLPPFMDKFSDVENQALLPVTELRPAISTSGGLRPPLYLNISHPPPLRPILPMQSHKGQYDYINSASQGLNKPFNTPGQLSDRFENKERFPQLPNQASLVAPVNPQNPRLTPFQPRHLPVTAPGPRPDSGYVQVHASAGGVGLLNPVLPPHLANIPNSSFHSHGRGFPPLPAGLPPPLQTILPQNSGQAVSGQQHPGGGFSNLITSLMAQGLISLNKPNPVQVQLSPLPACYCRGLIFRVNFAWVLTVLS